MGGIEEEEGGSQRSEMKYDIMDMGRRMLSININV
jgi:hypothetical protein